MPPLCTYTSTHVFISTERDKHMCLSLRVCTPYTCVYRYNCSWGPGSTVKLSITTFTFTVVAAALAIPVATYTSTPIARAMATAIALAKATAIAVASFRDCYRCRGTLNKYI